VAQLVEHHLAKVRVAGSSPVFRSISLPRSAPDAIESVESQAHADGFLIAVTGQRIIATDDNRPVMDIEFAELRRIQFDIERDRGATLVIVPEHVRNEPRVFSVPLANLNETAVTLALIGRRMNVAEERRS
jgi:hypothetical protein